MVLNVSVSGDASVSLPDGDELDGSSTAYDDNGNDVIEGGLGADQMHGQGGNDVFIVSSADEADGDIVVGGNGPDDASDYDVLDLRGAGQVTVNSAADSTDDDAYAGTVEFENGEVLVLQPDRRNPDRRPDFWQSGIRLQLTTRSALS